MMDFNKDSYLNFKSNLIGFLRKSGLSVKEAKLFFHGGYQALPCAKAGEPDSENPTAKDSASGEKSEVGKPKGERLPGLIFQEFLILNRKEKSK